jgi:hypothetical protein
MIIFMIITTSTCLNEKWEKNSLIDLEKDMLHKHHIKGIFNYKNKTKSFK